MASIKTKLMVGLFVLIGFTLATVSIIWLGMSNYFEKGLYYVAYFDESVQGLDKDSPVKYRGVPIGRVQSIKVAPDATLIEVVMKIEEGLKPKEHLQDVVAELKSVGITGIMFVEIERKQKGAPDYSPPINFTTKYPVIATKPSEIKKLIQGIDDIVKQIKSMDLIGMSHKMKSVLETADQGVKDLQIKELSLDIRTTLDGIKKLMESLETTSTAVNALAAHANRAVSRFDGIVGNNENEINKIISNFSRFLHQTDRLVTSGETLIKSADNRMAAFNYQLGDTLNRFENAAAEFTRLMEQIGDQPSQLILGSPPSPKTVEPSVTEP